MALEVAIDAGTLFSVRATLLIAFVSALARAGLNVVDRHQMSRGDVCVWRISFFNGLAPALAMFALCQALGSASSYLSSVLSWRCALFALTVQMVSYAFTLAFRHLSVPSVTAVSKLSDATIPAAIYVSAGIWSTLDSIFAAITAVVCVPLFLGQIKPPRRRFFGYSVAIVAALTVQGGASQALVSGNTENPVELMAFASAALAWRVLWTLIPLVWNRQLQEVTPPPVRVPFFWTRTALAVVTQLTFVLAVASPASAAAWPVLNSTALMGAVLSAFLLRERPSSIELITLTALFGCVVMRFWLG